MPSKGEFGLFLATLLRGLPCQQQIIYSWLYFRRNKEGYCHPSLNTLGRDTGIKSRTTLCIHLKELEKIGLIRREYRAKENGGHDSTAYKVLEKPTK